MRKQERKDAATLREDVDLVDGVHGVLNVEDYLAAKVAPVFFGSAINNFGVKELLDTFIRIAPLPQCRATSARVVCPDEEKLSGFILRFMLTLIQNIEIELHL